MEKTQAFIEIETLMKKNDACSAFEREECQEIAEIIGRTNGL